jgi:hypothetical protein
MYDEEFSMAAQMEHKSSFDRDLFCLLWMRDYFSAQPFALNFCVG